MNRPHLGRTPTAEAALDPTYTFTIDSRPNPGHRLQHHPAILRIGSIAAMLEPGITTVFDIVDRHHEAIRISYDPTPPVDCQHHPRHETAG